MNKSKNTILIVDDENSNIMSLTHILNQEYTIYAAKNGQKALAAAGKHLPDVILLDVIMPEMDGYDVIAALKNSPKTKDIPVIFITGLSDTDAEEKGLALGAADYITKPFSSALVKLRVLNQMRLIEEFRANEYNIMKYKLSNDALNIALWDMNIVCSDPVNYDNKITYSQEFRHMLGYSDENDFPNVLHSWTECLHPDDKEKTLKAFKAHMNDCTGKIPFNIEYRVNAKDGEEKIFHALGASYKDSAGTPIRVAGSVMDITKKKQTEKSLERQNNLLRAVSQTASLLLTVDNNVDFESAVMKSMEIIGRSVDADRVHLWHIEHKGDETYFVHTKCWLSEIGKQKKPMPIGFTLPYGAKPEWESKFMMGECVNDSISNLSHENRTFFESFDIKSVVLIPLHLNEQFWGLFSIDDCAKERSFTEDEVSILYSVSHMLVNTVNRRILTEAVGEAEKRIEIMLNATPLCCELWDSDHNIIDCNEETVKFFGVKNKREYIDRVFDFSPEFQPDGTPSDEKAEYYIKQTLEKGRNVHEWTHQLRDGTPVPVEATLVRVKYKDDYVIAAYSRDLREYYKMVKEMRKAAIAEETSRAKSAFLANMSHEIRTPMNSILGNTEILMQSEPPYGETAEGLRRIHNSCNMLLGIINDILDFSKIEAGKMDIASEEYNMASLINDSIHMNIMRDSDKPIEFETVIDENIPLKLIGDEVRIKQILNNLLSNAFKYTDSGKITLSVAYEEKEPDSNDNEDIMLVLSVQDTGHGMTEKQVSKLFDEYSRFNRDSGYTIEGTGLGLAITRHLANLMNGDIQVRSEPKKGTMFTVRLLQKRLGDEVIGSEMAKNLKHFLPDDSTNEKHEIIREPMPYGKVLIVDDVEANLYVAAGLMKPYKLQIDTVISGFEAIDKIKDGNVYDIIFMDHMMPKMDGVETTKHLRNLGYTKPVVALTANALAGQAEVFLRNGFDDFISKPIDIRYLNSTLIKLIRNKYPADVVEAARQKVDETKKMAQASLNTLLAQEIYGLDIAEGLERFDNDGEAYLNILRSYTANVRSLLTSIETVNEESLSNYHITVHGIKGASLNINANQVGQSAASLEQAAKSGDFRYIEKYNPAFIGAAQKLVYDIDAALSLVDDVKPQKHVKDKPDSESLTGLLEACDNYDLNGIEKAMAEIEKYKYDADDGLVEWLRENIALLNLTHIVEKLANLV